jgi:hypothetical protein
LREAIIPRVPACAGSESPKSTFEEIQHEVDHTAGESAAFRDGDQQLRRQSLMAFRLA